MMLKKVILLLILLYSEFSIAMDKPLSMDKRPFSPRSGALVRGLQDEQTCINANKFIIAMHSFAGLLFCLSIPKTGLLGLFSSISCCCSAASRCIYTQELEDERDDVFNDSATRNVWRIVFCIFPQKKVQYPLSDIENQKEH